MSLTLTITSKAQEDFRTALEWYEKQVTGLGEEFVRCVDIQVRSVGRQPQRFPVVHANSIKRALISRFPYAIYFVEKRENVIVIAILHQRVNPRTWQKRDR